ncbi:hypothetical protein OH77DRAFT_1417147 [Trametes cingulata]|nr:hypothetical protein OH77DRAFT_1417147 [Trametes cingulata]
MGAHYQALRQPYTYRLFCRTSRHARCPRPDIPPMYTRYAGTGYSGLCSFSPSHGATSKGTVEACRQSGPRPWTIPNRDVARTPLTNLTLRGLRMLCSTPRAAAASPRAPVRLPRWSRVATTRPASAVMLRRSRLWLSHRAVRRNMLKLS